MSQVHSRIQRAMMSNFGHAIIGTNDNKRNFAYTVGLTDFGLPELIIFGVRQEHAAIFLNDIAALMKQTGVPEDGSINTEVAHLPMGFKDVTSVQAAAYACQALFHYQDQPAAKNMRFIQLVIPDRAGLLPWQDGFDADYMAKFQPHLWEQPV